MAIATMKTVAAFSNSREGGTLLIGVADDGTALGLELDYLTLRKEGKVVADLLQLALTQAVLNSVGAAAATSVTSQVHTVVGKRRVPSTPQTKRPSRPRRSDDVDKNGQHQKKRLFYVRMNNRTRSIDGESEIEKYIAIRWGK